MKNYKIAVLPGDGIGKEVIEQTTKILDMVAQKHQFTLEYEYGLIGGIAIDECDTPLPQKTLDMCKASDAVLLGAVGGPKWDNLSGDKRPEAGLLAIRKGLGLYANLRPAVIWQALKDASPLKQSIIEKGVDILVIRELTGGIYFGKRGRVGEDSKAPDAAAYDTMYYSRYEVERIAEVAFEAARERKGHVTSVDKANVLENSRFWREIVLEVAKKYPDVKLDHMYVDNAAMQMVIKPEQFDVILTGNMFGDILSDEASMITGSIGMLPSASLGKDKFGLYEPVHGSAPDIAGMNKANPTAAILSAAMMLRYTLGEVEAADDIEVAVEKVLNSGLRTGDIAASGEKVIGCTEMGEAIAKKL